MSSVSESVRKLERDNELLRANRRQLADEARALGAELGGVDTSTTTTAAYNHCLFCNNDYGEPNEPSMTYETMKAACGCTGVGRDCAEHGYKTDMTGRRRVFGCKRLDQKCYRCRQAKIK